MSLVSSCCQTAKLCLKEKIENNPKGCNKDNALCSGVFIVHFQSVVTYLESASQTKFCSKSISS